LGAAAASSVHVRLRVDITIVRISHWKKMDGTTILIDTKMAQPSG
jgi:hypothetical protein